MYLQYFGAITPIESLLKIFLSEGKRVSQVASYTNSDLKTKYASTWYLISNLVSTIKQLKQKNQYNDQMHKLMSRKMQIGETVESTQAIVRDFERSHRK